ncbi:MAG TPA: hypothetical protein VGL23_08880, partial [Chloroflexota bacterium]
MMTSPVSRFAPLGRRAFLSALGLAGAALVAACGGTSPSAPTAAPTKPAAGAAATSAPAAGATTAPAGAAATAPSGAATKPAAAAATKPAAQAGAAGAFAGSILFGSPIALTGS